MTIREHFDRMDYGPAPESAGDALAWIVDQGSRFGHFVDGAFTDPTDDFESKNPANGNTLATLSQATQADVDRAVKAARKAQAAWAKDGHKRARVLYAIARLLQKHARLFAVLETLDNGKPIRESRDIDIPLAQRHFYYHAGLAQLMAEELPGRSPLGVCGQIIPWNFPLLMLAWKIAPALAAGNTVVLKPAEYTSLTALLFADICREAGVPKGVVNILTGDGAVGEMIVDADVDKIAFTGSTAVGRRIREATAGRDIALTLELGGKSPYIVFDDADLDSAVEGLVDAIWFNQGQVCCAGSRLLVQEGIEQRFLGKLKRRMEALRIGDPLDKCIDVGAVVDPVQLETITRLVDSNTAGETFRAPAPLPEGGSFYPPTLITGLHPADPLMQEEIFGPVLVSTTFRTPTEAVQVANMTRYGLAASVWSENVNLALHIAPQLKAGVVWVNGTNMFDAAAGFGGVRESGFGREGGWEGLTAYTKPDVSHAKHAFPKPYTGDRIPDAGVDRTAKLYIGGKQTRPDGGYSRNVYGPNSRLLGQVPIANRKDARNAVEAAAGTKWAGTTGHLRAQILYFLAENLDARSEEFAARLKDMTGKDGKAEVATSVERLFHWAAWADKVDGRA
ncbi:MAG: aldehyde dehydrogenase family protein, partial [Shimia sp.]